MMCTFFCDPAIKRAIVGAILVSLSGAPLGVMLVLRRMSLMGDVLAHAILPGTAIGFLVAGMSITAMSMGGLIAGLLIALVAGLATRFTSIREDANMVTFYLMAVALGIMLISLNGSSENLEDILFGDAKAVTDQALIVMASVTSLTLLLFAVIYRPLVVESFDPAFMKSVRGHGGLYHILFMLMVVVNMVEGYRTLGTLMSSGLLLIPAVTAQFWSRRLSGLMILAILIAISASIVGIAVAEAYQIPSGPSIVLITGLIYILSALLGRHGSVRARYFPARHLET
ncbi:MAG: metal ABC transporter permease [Alphaproteobacteria bacterium]